MTPEEIQAAIDKAVNERLNDQERKSTVKKEPEIDTEENERLEMKALQDELAKTKQDYAESQKLLKEYQLKQSSKQIDNSAINAFRLNKNEK